MRIISFASFDAHTLPIFARLNIIKFPDLIFLILFFNYFLSINIFWVTIPHFFSNIFALKYYTHEQNTRSASHGLLTKPSCSTLKYGINTFAASAIKSWNFFQKRFSNNKVSYHKVSCPTLNSYCWLRTTFLILTIRDLVKN